uniref:ER membrane protein complex subunit 6 n=1 Tax=Phaeocystis antarctica TaxID=33657 RepID=A0A7S0HSP5_9EUKA|mmetsp:Transcript_17586/g.41771  ORF Transcript_17586/g.41771 Transcript_17586/m.41771 type:complete len:112 (-) Transcript_17586:148-483(-)
MQPAAEADVDLSEIFSMDKIAYNARNINYCRVFVAILAGAASGIMGLEGIAGFVAFFASSMVLSLGMYLKMNSNPKPYFKTGSDVWTEGIGQALMSYVMFWTLFFDIVHIY